MGDIARQQYLPESQTGIGTNQFNSMPMPERFWAYTEKHGDCLLWKGATNANGYGAFYFKKKIVTASRVAFELTNGPIPTGLFVCHKCDTPLCVNPDHLFLGTHEDNMIDRDKKNPMGGIVTTSKGEGNVKAKLSAHNVFEIRRSILGSRALARQYGVDRTTIQRIRSKKIWSHI